MHEEQSTEALLLLSLKFNCQQDFPSGFIRDVQNLLSIRTVGYWNDETVTALARWQAARALPGMGSMTAATLAAIEALWASDPRAVSLLQPLDLNQITDLDAVLPKAVAEAEADWRAGTSEADTSRDGNLGAIAYDSGWSKYGDILNEQGKAWDWCGMAVVSWLVRSGLAQTLRRSFFATGNVHDFFTYRHPPRNSDRTKEWVRIDNKLQRIQSYHAQLGKPRRWCGYDVVRSTELGALDILPGDVVLINHNGETDGAHHITMVRSWDGRVLETIEGNASGSAPDGSARRDAVVINRRDLESDRARKKIFGIGRLSVADFWDLQYS